MWLVAITLDSARYKVFPSVEENPLDSAERHLGQYLYDRGGEKDVLSKKYEIKQTTNKWKQLIKFSS